jgi:thiol:disulfide interchange protein
MKIIVSIVLLLSSCSSPKEFVEQEDIMLMNYEAYPLLSEVLMKAEKEDKIVFIDMYADWCLPCKVMDEEVFNDKATADFMNANFINYKVNGEKGEGPDLAVIYQVRGYPTHLFVDAKGRVLERNLGGMGLVSFNVLAERVLTMNKAQ